MSWCHPVSPLGARAQRGARSSGSGAAIPVGKAFPTKPSRPWARGAGTGGDISGGGLGDKVSWSILGSLWPIPADPNWEHWERTWDVCLPQGVTRGPLPHPEDPHHGSSGITAVPISGGAENLEIPGFYKPCQDPILVWGSLLGILQLPVTPERPFPCPHPSHPCPSNLPVFPRSDFMDFEDFTPFPSSLPCHPCNSQGSVPPSSGPRSLLFSRTSCPGIQPFQPSHRVPHSHFFPLLGKSQPFISQVLGCQRLEAFPGKSVVDGIFSDGGCSPAVSEFSWFFYGIAVNSGNHGSRVR